MLAGLAADGKQAGPTFTQEASLTVRHLPISVRLNVAIEKRQNQYGAPILGIKVCNG